MPTIKILKHIVIWLKKQIYVTHKQGACTKIALHHIGTTGRLGPEVMIVNVGENKQVGEQVNDEDIEGMAAELAAEATTYAEGVGMTQAFALAAYFEEDDSRPLARQTFTVHVEVEQEDSEVTSEPANIAGMSKQLMRHNEVTMRMMVSSFGTVLNTLQQQNRQLSEMVGTMLHDKVEQIEAVEAVISAKHQRAIEEKREEISANQKAQVLDNVLALLPAVANRAIGKKILPETTDVIQLQIMKFVEALTPTEVEKLMSAVDAPEKKIALVQLLELVQNKVGSIDHERPNNSTS